MRWIFQPIRRPSLCIGVRCSSHNQLSRSLATVTCLNSWDLGTFSAQAFHPAKPTKLLPDDRYVPSAYDKWFLQGPMTSPAKPVELRTSFWSEYEDTMVPLELTSRSTTTGVAQSTSTFHRSEAPLKVLLAYLGQPIPPSAKPIEPEHSIYLAQCSLSSLPKSLREDVATPDLVLRVGKGDVYDSSLWLGRPPTYTPLHRDPNPNFFLQLAGRKMVRLLPPEVGVAAFDQVREHLRQRGCAIAGSAVFRGEEMMAGPEAELLHQAIWEPDSEIGDLMVAYGQEAEVDAREALFIPKGWWHSVKGVGEGITATVNWWFR